MKDLAIDQANALKDFEGYLKMYLKICNRIKVYKGPEVIDVVKEWYLIEQQLCEAFLKAFDIEHLFPCFKGFNREDFFRSGSIYTYEECDRETVYEVCLHIDSDNVTLSCGSYNGIIFQCTLEDFPNHFNDFIACNDEIVEYTNNIRIVLTEITKKLNVITHE